ncbi:unnamed protein product [Thlaspi arvense]|uniref:Uncharacterized protein n=1 Tax=Thlaspi arvense TaxID=13288 RepID=A0AAU9TC05_THLAR|nr:unnamed protein product [Thlaspi arvense]
MIISESPSKVENSTPVVNSPETAKENGGFPKKPSFTSPTTKRISESPIKDVFSPVATPKTAAQVKSRWSFSSSKRSFGSSKDETYFDSYEWQQSDSEDDFYSVNGEFTPSRGNTPKSSFSDRVPPRFHNPLFEEEKPRVSFSQLPPPPRRKKLGELFRDSIREEREVIMMMEESSENQSEESSKKSSSGDNSGELKVTESSEKEIKNLKSLSYHHRCLPRFSSFKGSLMEKRKRKKKKKNIHVK